MLPRIISDDARTIPTLLRRRRTSQLTVTDCFHRMDSSVDNYAMGFTDSCPGRDPGDGGASDLRVGIGRSELSPPNPPEGVPTWLAELALEAKDSPIAATGCGFAPWDYA